MSVESVTQAVSNLALQFGDDDAESGAMVSAPCSCDLYSLPLQPASQTNFVLWPLYRSTCVSQHLQLRTGGFCWCRVLLPKQNLAVLNWRCQPMQVDLYIHARLTALFGTTWVSQYQKGKTNLDFAEARDSEWQWH